MVDTIGHNLEIESTFLPKYLPAGLDRIVPSTITDIYLSPPEDLLTKLRLRNSNGQKFRLTKKVVLDPSDVSTQQEYDTPLTKEEYETLAELPGRCVTKDRYGINIDGHTAEVDLFRGPLSGFVLIEFEFPNQQAREAFKVPEICGTDVTQEGFIAGAHLAGKSYEDISVNLARLGYARLNYE